MASHSSSHVPPAIVYYRTYGLLVLLLVATVGAAYIDLQHWIHIPGLNLMIALVIAIVKAALVVLFFMNVRGSSRLTWLWAAVGFIWLLIMAGIVLDYVSRSWMKVPGWE